MVHVAGVYVCDCGNAVPVAEVAQHHDGRSGLVITLPGEVWCGECAHQMNIVQRGEQHGAMPRVPGGDHLGATGGRDEGAARREGVPGGGRGPLPDHGVQRPAEDRAGEPGEPAPGDGGSSGDLPPTARDLSGERVSIGAPYIITQGEFVDCVGELRHVEFTSFGHGYATLDVHTDEGFKENAARVRIESLQPFCETP